MPRDFAYPLLWLLIGWSLIGVVIYLSLSVNPPELVEFESSDKLKHMFAYAVLMTWFGQLYPAFRSQVHWAVFFVGMGVLLEFFQGWSGYRMFELADMAANTLGVLLGWWLARQWCAGWLLGLDQRFSRS